MRFDTNDGISRSKYTLSVLTLICTVVENRVGGERGQEIRFSAGGNSIFQFL